jgi:hypothetical protein
MGTKDRRLLEQLIKTWAQDHTPDFTLADFDSTQEAMNLTSSYLTWAIREGHVSLDLWSLMERIEDWLDAKKKSKHLDGTFCCKCGIFYQYAEPNQDDGSLICYSCRDNPYR